MKKVLLVFLCLVLIGLAAFFIFAPGIAVKRLNPVASHQPFQVTEKAQALHQRLSIVDWHADSLLWKRDLLQHDDKGHLDFPRLREGNVALQVFTTVTKSPAGLNHNKNFAETRDQITLLAMGQLWPRRTWQDLTERALYQAEKLHAMAVANPDGIMMIRHRADLQALLRKRAQGQDIIGAMLGAEGGHALSAKLENLERLDNAGFRMIGLTHFFDNALGGSLHGVSGAGLTAFGREVIREMEARRMIVDLAHASTQMAEDVLEMATRPVVVSHTGIYSHCQTRRNFPDKLMRRIAGQGGLIAIGYWRAVTCDNSVQGVAKAIIAAINLVGEDHVALGSDYDGSVKVAFDTSELAGLTQTLLAEGVSEATLKKIMGGNSMRFLLENLPAE